jgi:short-subunit dehydrogenase
MPKYVALVTGASRGIGKAVVAELESCGEKVIPHIRSEMGDLRSKETLDLLRREAIKNRVNLLINCAGAYEYESLLYVSDERIQEIMQTNLVVPMLLTGRLWPLLVQTKGTVININSVAGRSPRHESEIVYRTSKFGLTGFSYSLAFDGSKVGVRVIDIPFGGICTDMIKKRPGFVYDPLRTPKVAAEVVMQILNSSPFEKIKHDLIKGDVIDNKNAL